MLVRYSSVCVAQVERLYAEHRKRASAATEGAEEQDNAVEALPVVVSSHCWFDPGQQQADSDKSYTLAAIAKELAGGWDHLSPTHGLPLFRAWGFDDVGVFVDWASLYQDHGGATKRTATASKRERSLSPSSERAMHV